ncbi:hypothetical protein UY3_15034 [Chelonia mydas]|uniref:Uncharacterized protein n=1 Tax=Chelonia mydas TaxID=8469 RepID=M7BI01_CHEMY|nr:hypothetical protein UY3_15034 [Chelonia mydas]
MAQALLLAASVLFCLALGGGEVQFLIQGCIMNPSRCGLVKDLLDPEYQINITCCSHASFCNDLGPPAPSKGGR